LAAVTSVGRATGLEPLGLAVDSHAEEALFQRNSSRVFGFCLSRLRRREDAEDALQTTFLYAFRSLRRGVVPLVESAWLLGIARNVCLERWEAAGKRSRVESSCDPGELARAAPALADRPDELIGLEEALSRLPAQQRRAVVLRDWRGLSYDEVAAELGVSRAAVETMIFRGRRTLAEDLREGGRATGRRRLGSVANLGSLLAAIKALFGGGAAATKLAAALAVVAVSGAGIAVGESTLRGGGSGTPVPTRPQGAPTPTVEQPAPSISRPTSSSARPASARPAAAAPRPGVTRNGPAARQDSPSLAPGATGRTDAAPAPQPEAAPTALAPTRAPAPTPSAVPPAVKAPVQNVPLPPALEKPTAAASGVVESTPGAPVVGAVEEAAAPVVDPVVATVEDAAAPVVTTAEDAVEALPPVPPLLP
jgi:RNA polymerase sigma-70 factor (ECF subfamily)